MSEAELYRKHRPQKFSEVLGQKEAVKSLVEMGKSGKVKHCLLFSGPSGCGKTTMARIMRHKLKCSDMDFTEVNAAESRGIDMVREIQGRVSLAPMGGETRVWLIDEAQKLTGDAQSAFLKLLEDPPDHVYFMLATTEPAKLLPTIRTRSTEIRVKLLDKKMMDELLESVAEKEGLKIAGDVRAALVEAAEGSARKALVLLDQVANLKDEEEQKAVLAAGDASAQAKDLCRLLLKKAPWKQLAGVLKEIDEDPESLRYAILYYCQAVLLNSGMQRAFEIIDVMQDNLYDGKKPALVARCWELSK